MFSWGMWEEQFRGRRNGSWSEPAWEWVKNVKIKIHHPLCLCGEREKQKWK
jgi:hypothetical protein